MARELSPLQWRFEKQKSFHIVFRGPESRAKDTGSRLTDLHGALDTLNWCEKKRMVVTQWNM